MFFLKMGNGCLFLRLKKTATIQQVDDLTRTWEKLFLAYKCKIIRAGKLEANWNLKYAVASSPASAIGEIKNARARQHEVIISCDANGSENVMAFGKSYKVRNLFAELDAASGAVIIISNSSNGSEGPLRVMEREVEPRINAAISFYPHQTSGGLFGHIPEPTIITELQAGDIY
jgi:hypothetical protein